MIKLTRKNGKIEWLNFETIDGMMAYGPCVQWNVIQKIEEVPVSESPWSQDERGDSKNEVVIATYSIVIDVEVMEKSGHVIKKVTYPDVMLPSTVASVLRDAAKSKEL